MIEKKGFYSDEPAGENTRIIDRSFITQHLTISFVKVTRVATMKWVESHSNVEFDLFLNRMGLWEVLEIALLCNDWQLITKLLSRLYAIRLLNNKFHGLSPSAVTTFFCLTRGFQTMHDYSVI